LKERKYNKIFITESAPEKKPRNNLGPKPFSLVKFQKYSTTNGPVRE
jgi:hypothetical protein